MGIIFVASFTARVSVGPFGDDYVRFEIDQFAGESGNALQFSVCIAIFKEEVFPLYVTTFI